MKLYIDLHLLFLFPEKKISNFIDKCDSKIITHVYKITMKLKKKLIQFKSEKYETNFLVEENKRLKKLIDEYIYNSEEIC